MTSKIQCGKIPFILQLLRGARHGIYSNVAEGFAAEVR